MSSGRQIADLVNLLTKFKSGTGYVLYYRHHGGSNPKLPGQGEAPTPQTVLTVGPKGRFNVMSKSERRNRTATLPPVRCLPEERDEIRQKAEDAGLSIGAFMLRAALGRKIAPQTDHKLINELSRLGGLQKHLFKEGNGVGSKEYAEILQAIKAAIFRIEQKND